MNLIQMLHEQKYHRIVNKRFCVTATEVGMTIETCEVANGESAVIRISVHT